MDRTLPGFCFDSVHRNKIINFVHLAPVIVLYTNRMGTVNHDMFFILADSLQRLT